MDSEKLGRTIGKFSSHPTMLKIKNIVNFSVVTKTGSDHKPPANDHKLPQTTTNHQETTQTTKNDHKPPANNYKLPQTTRKRPQTTTNHQQTTTIKIKPNKLFPNSNYLVFS